MPALHRSVLRTLTTVAAAAGVAVAMATSASAATVTVTEHFDCQGQTPLGAQQFGLDQGATVTAPDTAAPGSDVTIVIDPAPNTIPSSVNGYTVKRVENMNLKVPIPANSTFVSAELTGGSNLGPNPPTWSVTDGIGTIHLDGPIAGGTTFELPTVTVHLTAGSSGTIDTKLYGTSYSDPGLTFAAVVSSFLGDINVPTSCFPNPNNVITSTPIG